MKDSAFDLLLIGHLLKEKIIFPDGKEMGPVLGSPAAYTSVASARLGLKTCLVTKIGNDMPQELLRVFTKAGVDTRGIKINQNTTTNLLIYEKSGGKRLQFLKKADNIFFKDIPEEYLDAQFFLIAPVDYEIEEGLMKSLHQKGKKLSMELSGFGGASSSKNGKTKEEKIEFLKMITPYFEIVKGGRDDCSCLFGDLGEREAAKKFIEWGAKIAIITLGGEGALVAARHREELIPAFSPHTAEIDCTGAGDVWHAGFLFGYLKTKDLKKAGVFASALSSLIIEKTGGVKVERFPKVEQVYERMKIGG